jgi:hypothetical protein
MSYFVRFIFIVVVVVVVVVVVSSVPALLVDRSRGFDLKICTAVGNASGFVIYFWRFKGSLARTRVSMSLGPPKAPLVTAMARARQSTRARARNRLDSFMRQKE